MRSLLRVYRVPDSLKECQPAKFRELIFGDVYQRCSFEKDFTKDSNCESYVYYYGKGELVEVFALREIV